MLIENGYIRIKTEPVLSWDENGNPISSGGVYGDFIRCQYRPNRLNNVGIAISGVFNMAMYTFLVDMQIVELNGSIVELFNDEKVSLGEYQSTRADLLPHVDFVKFYLTNYSANAN